MFDKVLNSSLVPIVIWYIDIKLSWLADFTASWSLHCMRTRGVVVPVNIYLLKVNNRNSLAPEIMTGVFETKEPHYNLCYEASHFKKANVKSTHYGIQYVRHLGPKIWNIVPQNIRESNSLNEFKSLIKFWKPDTCPCRLCKNYIAQVGFIWSYMHRNYLSFLFKSFFFLVVVN